MTPEVCEWIAGASDLVGYGPYLDLLPTRHGQARHPSGNRGEAERARFALDLAARGSDVAVVSSGDPGVFAMASAVVEELTEPVAVAAGDYRSVKVVIAPGVTAATAAAARVGAPLGHDFCVISLSDNLKPWEVIERRLNAAASADFVVALYNPSSRARPWQFTHALSVIAQFRSAGTPVLIATAVGREGEAVEIAALDQVEPHRVGMNTVVIVGSSETVARPDAAGRLWMFTPRRYP